MLVLGTWTRLDLSDPTNKEPPVPLVEDEGFDLPTTR